MAQNFTLISNDEYHNLDGLLEIPDLEREPKSTWCSFEPASNLLPLQSDLPRRSLESLLELGSEVVLCGSHDEPLPRLDTLAESTSASETGEDCSKDEFSRDEEELEDLWSLKDVVDGRKEPKLLSWDTFLNSQAGRPQSAYLSEAGPACVDAVLDSRVSGINNKLPKLVGQHQDFLRSIFELGVGRDSLLYRYDQKRASFVLVIQDFGLSGISSEVQNGVLHDMLKMGNCIRELEAFVLEPKVNPLSIALSSAVSTILYSIKAQLQTSKNRIRSIIQLKDLFFRPSCLLETLQHLVKSIGTTASARESIIKLTHESEHWVLQHAWQAPLLHEILRRTSAPWRSALEAGVGLQPGPAASETWTLLLSETFGTRERTSARGEEAVLKPIDEVVSESRRCLVILRGEQADHPLVDSSNIPFSRLQWQVSWEDILQIEVQANEYEQSLKEAVFKYNGGTSAENSSPRHGEMGEVSSSPSNEFILVDLDEPHVLGRGLGCGSSSVESSLSKLTTAALTAEIEPSDPAAHSELYPPFCQSLSLSLMPLLNAQSRLLSFSTFHLLFKTHSLLSHLSLQHRFQLLSDGPFASRLSRALFDPDQVSGEGSSAIEGTTGLHLQARDTWPPANSELRLVLMGILRECYHRPDGSGGRKGDDLPGNLSFAIRDLTAEEQEKCRDVRSVQALDFLRLQYTPPPVLESVITKSSLRKYDLIFKYMLRLLRMQVIAQGLLRDVACKDGRVDGISQRLRIDIQHFISTLASYSSNEAIGMTWSRFQGLLTKIEAAIEEGDYEGTIATAGSLLGLERLHETALDRMIKALFLHRRHTQVREIIEGIFQLILRFNTIVEERRNEERITDDDALKIHRELKRQIGRLVRHLRPQVSCFTANKDVEWDANGLSLKGGSPPFEHLLLKLDLFGYFT